MEGINMLCDIMNTHVIVLNPKDSIKKAIKPYE